MIVVNIDNGGENISGSNTETEGTVVKILHFSSKIIKIFTVSYKSGMKN